MISSFLLFLYAISILRVLIVLLGGKVVNFEEPSSGKHSHNSGFMYTIIIPMFMERGRDVAGIRNHLLQMEYESYEILYLCEDIDITLIKFIKSLNLKPFERIIYIPRIIPFTKPKACNYGLEFAKGRYIVVYDIEDRPHLKQLQIAHQTFINNPHYSCIQFPLEFISDGTAMGLWQHIDYLIWYKRLLPILVWLKLPIPLGGTSNHFRVNDLRKISGWNSYNVTEDAELGLRMHRLKMQVAYISAYQTKEVVAKNIVNLMKQRVRWSKGHILTALEFLTHKPKPSYLDAISVFFVLLSTPLCYISYALLTTANGFYHKSSIMILMILGVTLFFLYPVFIIISFPHLRKTQNILPTILLPFYYIFYTVPIAISIIECMVKPSVWYKTRR